MDVAGDRDGDQPRASELPSIRSMRTLAVGWRGHESDCGSRATDQRHRRRCRARSQRRARAQGRAPRVCAEATTIGSAGLAEQAGGLASGSQGRRPQVLRRPHRRQRARRDPGDRSGAAALRRRSGVTFADLVAATLPHGLVPIVVPELKTITIGGAVAGCSIESMSFVHGGFHDTCVEYEVVTAKGDVLTCTPDNEHRLLFQMMHGSFGTLGILTRLTFKLDRRRSRSCTSTTSATTTLEEYQPAIARSRRGTRRRLHGRHHPLARRAACCPSAASSTRRPYTHRYDWMRVYYQSTRTRARGLPARRPTTSFATTAASRTCTRSRSIGRLLFGKLLELDADAAARQQAPLAAPADRPTRDRSTCSCRSSKVAAFMEWYERELGFFPLWCVPYRRVQRLRVAVGRVLRAHARHAVPRPRDLRHAPAARARTTTR